MHAGMDLQGTRRRHLSGHCSGCLGTREAVAWESCGDTSTHRCPRKCGGVLHIHAIYIFYYNCQSPSVQLPECLLYIYNYIYFLGCMWCRTCAKCFCLYRNICQISYFFLCHAYKYSTWSWDVIGGLITPVHSLMLSLRIPVYQVRLDHLCIALI